MRDCMFKEVKGQKGLSQIHSYLIRKKSINTETFKPWKQKQHSYQKLPIQSISTRMKRQSINGWLPNTGRHSHRFDFPFTTHELG